MAAALRVPAARPSSGSLGGLGTVPGQGHSRRQSGGGGVRTCLSTRPGWASGSPWSPVSPRGPPSKEGFVHCYGPVGGSGAGPGAGRPVGSQRGVRMGAVTAELTGARPLVAGVQSAGDGASRAAWSREPGAGSEGQLRPGCTAWWQVHSGCFSSQRQLEPPEGHPVPVCGWASAPCSELASVSVQAPVALSPALPCDVAHEGQRLPHRPAGTAMSCPSWACPRAGGAAPLGAARSSESLQPRGSRQA